MMKELQYVSVLADRLKAYVQLRRSLGFELRSQVYILRKFDRILQREMTRPGPVIREVVESEVLNTGEPKMIMERTLAGDHTSLIFLFMAFGMVWLYSVVDAFWGGRKADELEKIDEKLHDR